MKERQKGPVEILCREIGYHFSPGMENPRLLVAFVRKLVLEIAQMRWQAEAIAKVARAAAPSAGSGELLDKVLDMLNGGEPASMVEKCAGLHELARQINPEEGFPTDHLIDMLSSCISAIRFGLATGSLGFGSRHAAAASNHVWERRYGVSLFDGFTLKWRNEWACHKLQEALTALAFQPTALVTGPQR